MNKKSLFAICISIITGFVVLSATMIFINNARYGTNVVSIGGSKVAVVVTDKKTGQVWTHVSFPQEYWDDLETPQKK